MTDAEKDAAWRSLPEDFKRQLRCDYTAAESAHSLDPTNVRIEAHKYFLGMYFGKHNLTATEEPIQDKTMNKEELLKLRKERGKQTLIIGDKVRPISASGKPLYDGKVATIIEKGMSGDEVYYGLYIEGVAVEKRSTPLIGKSEIIGNTSLLAPFFAEDLELVASRAEEEEKPRFKVGDIVKVSQDMKWGNGESDKNKEILLNAPSKITEIQGKYALIEGAGESVYGLIPLKYLIPYAEEQEPKNGKSVDSLSSLQNEIPSMSKEDAEELAKCLAELDSAINKFKDSQVDWLAYRMELAKEVAAALIGKGHNIAFVAESTSLIVDGIVERLKGGEK